MRSVAKTFLLLSLICLLTCCLLCSCGGGAAEGDGEVILRLAIGAGGSENRISFGDVGEGIVLADGVKYREGDLKPVFARLEQILGVDIRDVARGCERVEDEFEYWRDSLSEVDILVGSAVQIAEAGADGLLVDLSDHLDRMPNLRRYLLSNPAMRGFFNCMGAAGAVYLSPALFAPDQLEYLPFMNAEWIKTLLNGEGEFTAESCGVLEQAYYEPQVPQLDKRTVSVMSADGSGEEILTRDHVRGGNIIGIMNSAIERGGLDGVQAVNMLRSYVDEVYGGYYGTSRADLFIGRNAAWDVDELVALLRCVKANAHTLCGGDSAGGIFFPDADLGSDRSAVYTAAMLFGVRGLGAGGEYLYSDVEGVIRDARQSEEAFVAFEKMRSLSLEGLISPSADKGLLCVGSSAFSGELSRDGFSAVMLPLTMWNDGMAEEATLTRFTDAQSGFGKYGVAISAAGVGADEKKLDAALKLIDYCYGEEGNALLGYGPNEFLQCDAMGAPVCGAYEGSRCYFYSDGVLSAAQAVGWGYGREYIGAGLLFNRTDFAQRQLYSEGVRTGESGLTDAIRCGLVATPSVGAECSWYLALPPYIASRYSTPNEYHRYDTVGEFNTGGGWERLMAELMLDGYGEEFTDREGAMSLITLTYGGEWYTDSKNLFWQLGLAEAAYLPY